MTDKEVLLRYRLDQAEETLRDVKNMLDGNFSPRTIINRSYYSMFYTLLALFIKYDINIKTSKHSGVISLFDSEFVKKAIIDKKYSRILHKFFDLRQESDYKDLKVYTFDEAEKFVATASEFVNEIMQIILK